MTNEASEAFDPIILGSVEQLTKGTGTGLSEASQYKTDGGQLDREPYSELPALSRS
jgi:hypothetical protein